MAFESVKNLAEIEAAKEARRRREDQEALARDVADEKAREAEGPAALLDQLTGGRRVGVDAATTQAANEDRFLNAQAQRRLGRRADALSDLPPTMPERMAKLLGPAAEIANENPDVASNELRTDPRGRLARLERVKEQLLGDVGGVPRETPPVYYSGNRNPTRELAEGVTAGGNGPPTMPYTGALEGLQGADVPRAAIRPEFGGTAPDRVLAFSDRPEPGMQRYNAPSGRTKDVGAPGGGFGVVRGAGGGNDAVRGELDNLIAEARRQPLTPRERAQDLVREEPVWDVKAAGLRDPGAIAEEINRAVAGGELDPATGQHLQKKYAAYARASVDPDDGSFDADEFANRLATNRAPAPGEAELRARTGGGQPQAVEAAKSQAVTDATTPVQGAPGTVTPPDFSRNGPQRGADATPTPAATEPPADPREALLGQMLRPQRQSQNVGGAELGYEIGGDFIPPNMREIPERFGALSDAARLGAPQGGRELEAAAGLKDLPEDIRLMLEGASFAAGGREAPAERRRRLAREAARRGG